MKKPNDRKEQIRQLRNQGLKYREIAEQVGVSTQYIAHVCGESNPARFSPFGSECVYPNLRKWMNENKISKSEILRRMGIEVHPNNLQRLGYYIRGEANPRKPYIDNLLKVTGLTYEVLFHEGEGAEDGK